MSAWQLAQLNIAQGTATVDDPSMADFLAQLAAVNQLAESSPGFVWRLQDDSGDATAIQAFDDPKLLVNMSLWTSVETLREFVYRNPDHRSVMADRKRWFVATEGPHMVLWWIPSDQRPSVKQARDRLAHLATFGPTEHAFTFAKTFPNPAETSP